MIDTFVQMLVPYAQYMTLYHTKQLSVSYYELILILQCRDIDNVHDIATVYR